MLARIAQWTAAVAAALAVCGCSKALPPVVPVSGVVLLDGKPLSHAKIEFVPDISGFGAETNSLAITDDQGRFTLANNFTQAPGAAVGKHHVLVTEPPTPKEFRGQDPAVQARFAEHLAKSGNRPIPKEYGVLATALVVEVTAEPKEYRIELQRRP
jgi:hypothetical protein